MSTPVDEASTFVSHQCSLDRHCFGVRPSVSLKVKVMFRMPKRTPSVDGNDAHAALVECFSKFRIRQSFAETFLLEKRVILADAS